MLPNGVILIFMAFLTNKKEENAIKVFGVLAVLRYFLASMFISNIELHTFLDKSQFLSNYTVFDRY